jgi:phenylpropionate dioxygenase-like ring-hydroxylating dioxygenase large terminal subunit
MSAIDAAFHAALPLFWHPVATVAELRAAEGSPDALALDDRCPHRSASLSCGRVEAEGIRCAYHGWRFGVDGRCNDLPAMPAGPIPARAAVGSYSTVAAYGLVWVRLDDRAGTALPACPAWGDGSFHLIEGAPYTWPVGAGRRVENFVDLSHFAFVHDGTLGSRDEPVPPLPAIARAEGELRFVYDPPELEVDPSAMFGRSVYRMPVPFTVSIEFTLGSGARRVLWMTASPVDEGTCRAFWLHGRDDDLDGDDAPYIAFQDVVLAEDEPVVCEQDPRPLPLDSGVELSVRTDKVSIEYRRWLRDIAEGWAQDGPDGVARTLGVTVSAS